MIPALRKPEVQAHFIPGARERNHFRMLILASMMAGLVDPSERARPEIGDEQWITTIIRAI